MEKYIYFNDIFQDYTKYSLKIPKNIYLTSGLYPIIDQGKEEIAGFSNQSTDIFNDVPVIIFGDHTRIFKYIDYPFFLGADGVKILKNISNLFLDKFLYYSLKNFKIPNTGYNRHFKWLKNFKIKYISLIEQKKIVNIIEKIEAFILQKKDQLNYLKKLNKSLFTRMFGDIKTNDKNWEIYYWKDVLNIKNGKNQKQVEDIEGKYPIYGSGGIIGYSNAYICNENTIIIGRKGNINKPILVKEKFWNVDTAFGLEVKKDKISYYYLYYFCLFYDFEIHNKAVTIPSLVKSDLEKILLPIPPIDLQNKFAERIEKIEKLKFIISAIILKPYELSKN
ncbi:restriction endonuclease subunit S [Fusobacterium pseudoperiodonticum]|uniref:restriction endonuclease subunit S n=1 Tax=Fusobacterium pseudoperiodonticum TaxID=2663009 RepID=UPI000C1C6C0A|nr:restriction endonuclease subunit S [Fusobacterium pseudoperiodonticum]ATV67163.1 restriction endonuclease subunit S [Fusobacterium pseudoperiodonticum]